MPTGNIKYHRDAQPTVPDVLLLNPHWRSFRKMYGEWIVEHRQNRSCGVNTGSANVTWRKHDPAQSRESRSIPSELGFDSESCGLCNFTADVRAIRVARSVGPPQEYFRAMLYDEVVQGIRDCQFASPSDGCAMYYQRYKYISLVTIPSMLSAMRGQTYHFISLLYD